MKKILLSIAVLAAMGISTGAKAQLVDEQNVTITMDLQPILQLKMNGPQNVDFVFDQIAEYVGGITKYGATQLMVSSTVDWDLYAVGYSSLATAEWDNQVVYGSGTGNATTHLPIELLEMRQDKANPDAAYLALGANFGDYFGAFVTSPSAVGTNNIFAMPGGGTPYNEPGVGEKYIAGGATNADFVVGGSYLIQNPIPGGPVGAPSNYYYSIDYRIVPGLPANFPNAATNAGGACQVPIAPGVFAQPGVYTMNVKYVLQENH